MKPIRLLISCLLLAASSAALADSKIYKYRLPDGRTLYTQNRVARGTLEEVIRVPSPSTAQAVRAQRELDRDRALSQRLETNRDRLASAETHVQQAERALNEAEAALQHGLEPRPGERQATATGASRLNDAYWDRLLALRQAVNIARQRLELATSDYEAARLAGVPSVETSGR